MIAAISACTTTHPATMLRTFHDHCYWCHAMACNSALKWSSSSICCCLQWASEVLCKAKTLGCHHLLCTQRKTRWTRTARMWHRIAAELASISEVNIIKPTTQTTSDYCHCCHTRWLMQFNTTRMQSLKVTWLPLCPTFQVGALCAAPSEAELILLYCCSTTQTHQLCGKLFSMCSSSPSGVHHEIVMSSTGHQGARVDGLGSHTIMWCSTAREWVIIMAEKKKNCSAWL